MKKIFRTVFLFSFILLLVSCFKENDTTILWNKNTKIAWTDFKDTVPSHPKYDAWSVSGIKYHYNVGWDSITVEVNSYFDYSTSWVVKDRETPYLLNHEQRHFDISEICARKLRQSLLAWDNKIPFKDYFKTCFDSILKLRQSEEENYDAETHHSKDIDGQSNWNKRVDSLLNAYAEFANSDFKIAKEK